MIPEQWDENADFLAASLADVAGECAVCDKYLAKRLPQACTMYALKNRSSETKEQDEKEKGAVPKARMRVNDCVGHIQRLRDRTAGRMRLTTKKQKTRKRNKQQTNNKKPHKQRSRME